MFLRKAGWFIFFTVVVVCTWFDFDSFNLHAHAIAHEFV